jgi:hypothetical protein
MAANPLWERLSDTSDTLNRGDEREAKTMRSKEEQEQIVKRALSAREFMATEGRIITAPTCFNCGAVMTPTADVSGKALWECRACAVGDGTDRPDGVVAAGG